MTVLEMPRFRRRFAVNASLDAGVFVVSTVAAILVVVLTLGTWAWQRQAKLGAEAAAEAVANREKSVAVLPFENLSTEEQNAVFAGGVHREVLLNLAKIADLKVISRTSVMRYKPGSRPEYKTDRGRIGRVVCGGRQCAT